MDKEKTLKEILIISIISIIIMYIVDGIINPGYLYKSIVKVLSFFILPISYAIINKDIGLVKVFKIRNKRDIFISIFLGLFIYISIIGVYFVLKGFIDLNNIKDLLEENVKVNRENFIIVAIYISFINSLLEEFFFRGFIFLNLIRLISRRSSYIISATLFAIYHIAIMASWFSPILFILALLGLFIGAIIFNYLDEKNLNIYSSWLVHMMANFAINTIGLLMFEII